MEGKIREVLREIEILVEENKELKEENQELKNDKNYWYSAYLKAVELNDNYKEVTKISNEKTLLADNKIDLLQEKIEILEEENDKLKVMLFDAAMMMTDMMKDEDCNEVE